MQPYYIVSMPSQRAIEGFEEMVISSLDEDALSG